MTNEELSRAFNQQNVWRRAAIVIAGPAANFLLAILLYWALFLYGVQEAKPIVAMPDPGTVAAASGLQRGETILKVNDEPVASWQDLRWRIVRLAVDRRSARFEVIDPNRHIYWRVLDLSLFDLKGLEGDPLMRLGLRLYRPDIAPTIGNIITGAVAHSAGLRAGDQVVMIDRRPISTWNELVNTIRANPGKELHLLVERNGAMMDFILTPEAVEQNGERFGRIGAAPRLDPEAMSQMVTIVRYGLLAAGRMALVRGWETSEFSLQMLGKMLTGEVSWKNLSGPVTIADYAGQSAQMGPAAYLAFIALISISLGVLNLLPIPLLDGGHLMYYVLEVVKGSPVSERVMEVGQKFGLTVLLLLMAFAFYNDINRLLSG